MLSNIKPPKVDPILSLSLAYREDPRSEKVDLGIGVYKNDQGQTPIMSAVKKAHQAQLEDQQTKAYVGLAGNEIFNQSMIDLLLKNTNAYDRVSAIQTPGASGALRMLGDLLKIATPNTTVWLTNPSYVNHQPVMQAAGLNVAFFHYLDEQTYQVDEARMLADLSKAKAGDVVLLHGCCHNPTGADMDFSTWQQLTELVHKNGLIPFIDIAYQGFGEGLEADAKGLRYMAEHVDEMLIAQSCSKNFGLYRERTGSAIVIGQNQQTANNARAKLLNLVRANYTMPPDHGADLVARIMQDSKLKENWQTELSQMQQRLVQMRQALVCRLRDHYHLENFQFIAQHRGMFSVLGFNPQQMQKLRDDFGIYAVNDGRINIAGLQQKDIDYVAHAISSICQQN